MEICKAEKFFQDNGLIVDDLAFTMKGEGPQKEKHFHLRFFFPSESTLESLVAQLYSMRQHTQGKEKAFYHDVVRMLQFHSLLPPKEYISQRKFDLATIVDPGKVHPEKYSETFREIFQKGSLMGMSGIDRMKYIGVEVAEPDTMLLRKAILLQPNLRIPFVGQEYINLRNEVLDQIDDTRALVDRYIEKLPKVKEEKARIQEKLGEAVWERVKGALKQARENTEEDMEKYQPVKEKLKTFIEKYQALARKGPGHLEKALDTPDLNALIEELTKVFETELGFEVDFEKDLASEKKQSPGDQKWQAETEEIVGRLRDARNTDDLLKKWNTLVWTWASLVSFSELITLMQFEAENVLLGCLDYMMKETYRRIRRKLTPPERRFFALMWFRYYPMLGTPPRSPFLNRICTLDPVISSFFDGMDGDTKGLILTVLAFRVRTWENRNLEMELRKRWRMYLLFYPYWHAIIRMDEGKKKREQRFRHEFQCDSLFTPLDDVNKEILADIVPYIPPDQWFLSSEERVPCKKLFDAKYTPKDALRDISSIMDKYCTKKQREIIKLHFSDDMTEQEIAKHMTISQPAVHKHIVAGVRNIQNALRREGLI